MVTAGLRLSSVGLSNLPFFYLPLFIALSIQITEKCSAEVLFPSGEKQGSPEVQASCEELLKITVKAQEEALYQQYKMNQSLLSTQHLPGM